MSDNSRDTMNATEQESQSVNSNGSDERVLWSMSAVTRLTGLSQHTLRAWERRFGFPTPIRLSSRHRRYTQEDIDHLRLIVKALEKGHRAGDVVPLPLQSLKGLLGIEEERESPEKSEQQRWVNQMLEGAIAFDRDGLVHSLLHSSSSMGIHSFLQDRITPLLMEVGSAWADGRIEIRHEHFLSELLEDVLRSIRVSLEFQLTKKPIVLATLTQELHSLGLQMVALIIAQAGWKPRVLGVHTPVEDILAAAHSLEPAAVGLSVTMSSVSPETSMRLNMLYERLPVGTPLWVGGEGAAYLKSLDPNIRVLHSLELLRDELNTLAA